jgi:hypothetical protein
MTSWHAEQDELAARFLVWRLALAEELPDAGDHLTAIAERALAEGRTGLAAAAAGVALLADHLRSANYGNAPRLLAVLQAAGPASAAVGSDGLLAWAGAAVARDYAMLPGWPAADVGALMTRARQAPTDVALALACALGEVCERNGEDGAFEVLQAQVAAMGALPGASPFWRGYWAIVSAWHLCGFGKVDGAREMLETAQALAAEHGLVSLGASAALQRSRLLEWRSDPERALALADQAVAAGDPSTTPLWFADQADVRCSVAMRGLDFHAAIGHARRAIGHLRAGGAWPAFEVTYRANEAYALIGAGAPDQALLRLRALAALPLPDYLAARVRCLADLAGLMAADAGAWAAEPMPIGLTATLRRLRELEWPNVMVLLPQHIGRLFARALAQGVETDWVRAAIRLRRLPAPPGAPEAWPWAVKVRTLGSFEIHCSAGPLADGPAEGRKASGKPLELLRWLAARGLEATAIDQVAQTLWPGDGREGRQKAFEVTAARLRRLLGSDAAVIIHDHRVRLNGECVWVDVQALNDALAECSATAATGRDPVPAIEAALALYRGPCLADSAQDWAAAAADAMRARVAAALLRAAERAASKAREWMLRVRAADPEIARLFDPR